MRLRPRRQTLGSDPLPASGSPLARLACEGAGAPHWSHALANRYNVFFREPVLVTSAGASGGFDADGRPAVYRRALHLIEDKTINVAALISHRYSSLESVQEALQSGIHAPDYIKGVVTFD